MPKFGTKNAWFGYFWAGIWKQYCRTFLIAKFRIFRKKQKCLNLGSKMPYLSIFGREKTIVIFEISTFKFVKNESLTHIMNFGVEGPLFLKVQGPLFLKVLVWVRIRFIKYAFSNSFYNSDVFSEWNKLLLHTSNSAAISCIFSLYIPFNRNSEINFLRWYLKGLPRRPWLLDFYVKVSPLSRFYRF